MDIVGNEVYRVSNIIRWPEDWDFSPTQIEKSQPERKRITLETRFTEYPALSVDQRVGISRSASETDI